MNINMESLKLCFEDESLEFNCLNCIVRRKKQGGEQEEDVLAAHEGNAVLKDLLIIAATNNAYLIMGSMGMKDDNSDSVLFNEKWRIKMNATAWNMNARHDVIGDGKNEIFVGREDGEFYVYNTDGTPVWSHHFSAIISDFLIYKDPFSDQFLALVPSIDKTLRLLNARDGKLVWGDTFNSGVNCVAELTIQQHETHYIAAGGNDNTLRLYSRNINKEPSSYQMNWYHKFESYVRDVSISSTGKVAAVADDGYLKIFDIQSGEVSWIYEHGSFAWKCKIIDEEGIVISSSFQVPIRVDEGQGFLGNPGVISCHELMSGKLIWSSSPEDGFNITSWDFFKIKGNLCVVFGTTSGKVIVLDTRTGIKLHEFSTRGEVNDLISISFPEKVIIFSCSEKKADGAPISVFIVS
ncbi:MAG: outer membrane protein assembly factor BamB family protein [Promethearchaeota archaeon]